MGATSISRSLTCMDSRFQSTLPRWERPALHHLQNWKPSFQSTLPRWERRYSRFERSGNWRFQSTLPRWERPYNLCVESFVFGFNPRSRDGSDTYRYPSEEISTVSIHAPAMGATAISAKNSFQFSAEINKLSFYILYFPLFHPLFFLHFASFVHILECESPGIFMSASYSHSYIITKSMYHLLQFRDRHPYVPPLSDIYFPDNRT